MLLIVCVVLWVIWISIVLYFYVLGDQMFKLLSTQFPGYYSEKRKPIFFTFNFARNSRAQRYLQELFYKGIPNDFPNSKEARRLAQRTRKLNMKLHLFLVILVILTVSFILLTR